MTRASPGGHDKQGFQDASGLYEVERRATYAALPSFSSARNRRCLIDQAVTKNRR
jgi:hypothetical protein